MEQNALAHDIDEEIAPLLELCPNVIEIMDDQLDRCAQLPADVGRCQHRLGRIPIAVVGIGGIVDDNEQVIVRDIARMIVGDPAAAGV